MKKLSFTFFILFFSQQTYSQDIDWDAIYSYKGFPIEEVKYYYLSSESVLGNQPGIYTNVRMFICEKSKYSGSIKNLSEDLESQFNDHLGDKKRSSETQVHYFSSERDAKIHHRRRTNQDQAIIDYSFKYYCMD